MGPAKRTLAIVVMTASLVSCSGQPIPPTTPTLPTEALRIHAATATIPLVIDLSSAYAALHPLYIFDMRPANYQVLLEELMQGSIPYFITNHLPAGSQQNLWGVPIGQDAIVMIAHPALQIDALTTEQLRDIYRGRITQWQTLNPAQPGDIVVFSREDGSGTRAEFERMVMGARRTTPNARVASSSSFMVTAISQTENSIGYISMGHLGEGVKALAVNEVRPTQENILNNRYPLRSMLFVVGLQEPQDPYRQFFGWVQSPEGQQVVARRYAPLLNLLP